MSKPWTSWAAEAEAEEQEQAAAAAASSGDSKSFPSLKEAVSTKQKKKKISLQEFAMGTPLVGRRDSSSDFKGLTPDEMMRLPTGPKERSPEEMQYGRLGGGFSTYGRSGGYPARSMREREDADGDTSWGGAGRRSYGGGFDDDRRQPPHRASDFDQPSRADEVDNWAMAKKPLQSYDSGPSRPNRYGSLGGGGAGGAGAGEGMMMSRADEVDSWAAGKKLITPRSSSSSSSTFGSTFRNTGPGPEPERWSRGGGGGGGGSREVDQERPKLVLQARSEAALSEAPKGNKPNPFGAARPREEVLAEKGLDWKKIDLEIDAKKTSRPTSSHSSRPSSAQSNRSEGPALQGVEGATKPRPKMNPFGDAKPRELLLEEKGMDWRKIDLGLEHRGVGRPESDAEKNLKQEMDLLKKELEKVSAPNANEDAQLAGSSEQKEQLQNLILSKEKELDLLMHELDDKARSGQKLAERPGSGAGRVSGIPERPSSQSGRYEESRNVAAATFMDRPRSRGRGGGDAWTRQGDDRRSFRGGGGGGGGRETGFLGNNRDMDRSRERW